MTVPIFEARETLRLHHVPGLPAAVQCVAVLRTYGCPIKEVEARLHRSASSIYRDLERVGDAVFAPLGLERDPHLLAIWVDDHTACCLAAGVEAVR